MIGRSDYLTLCEVKAFGPIIKNSPQVVTPDYTVNFLTGATTSQSSTGWSGSPARAIDGNTNGQWSGNS
ncbi:MAG: hypothetical protein GY861_24155, partial [bacterium]|nr:hypothetical protein [bacterium]